ncbi:MAG: NAD(P)/FAD-dependent oxidoreductase [Dehalococcoidia bacterium]|nr:NAD(P)/FAD-dependent oxidoreductase [Dehalococcoidia bacterium]
MQQTAPSSTADTATAGAAGIHHTILIVGGGNAGVSVAARLRRANSDLDVAIVEPSAKHYYQPLWTLVGGGVFPKERSERPEASVIPPGVTWIQDRVARLAPDEDAVFTTSGARLTYRYLILAPGIQVDWDGIEGLEAALKTGNVVSNYSYETVDKTWAALQAFKGGEALFTHPNTPIKCGGAPQKIMYLADDHFRKTGVRARSEVRFLTAGGGLFGVPKYARTLEKVAARKGIDVRFKHNLIAVDSARQVATFCKLETSEEVALPYDFLHVTPPMSAPNFIKWSPVADAAGWAEVDRATLRHPRYPNIFALGDASNLPTSKTGAAIRKQAPVVVRNVLAALEGEPVISKYDGYTACPIVTGYGRLVLAEFDYDLKPRETFPFDQSRERRSMYLLKTQALPRMYWNGILKGRA